MFLAWKRNAFHYQSYELVAVSGFGVWHLWASGWTGSYSLSLHCVALRALSCVVSFFGPSHTTDRRWPGQRARSEVWSERNVKPALHWGVVCICNQGKHFSKSWDSPKGICFGLLTGSLQAERELRPEPWLLAIEIHFAELMGSERASQEKTEREGERGEGRREGASENVPCQRLCLKVACHYTCYSKVILPNWCDHTKQN